MMVGGRVGGGGVGGEEKLSFSNSSLIFRG